MSVLACSIKENLVNHHAFLEELKNFCQAQGWTIVRFLQNVQWKTTSPQSFIAGTESFLEVLSTGYGSQTLHFRLRMENAGSDSQAEWLHTAGHLGNTTLQSVSTHPVDQTGIWTNNKFLSIPAITIPTVWFFGNDKFILAVIKCDSTYVQFLTFGTLELFASSETQANFYGWSNTTQTNRKWYNKNTPCPFDQITDQVYYNSARKTSTNAGWNYTLTTGNGVTNGKFGSYGDGIVENENLDVRPIQKQLMYVEDSADSLWFTLGWSWIFRVWHEGLQIGERLVYGDQEYICFPMGRLEEWFLGVAVRVN